MIRYFAGNLLLLFLLTTSLSAQSIGNFISVEPQPQDDLFYLPSTHTWQFLIQRGDLLTSGDTMPFNSDFTGYIPIGGSSENGYLGVNSEWIPGGVTIFDIQFDPISGLWQITASEPVDFSHFSSQNAPGTKRPCSGTVTPWGTLVSCEEDAGPDLNGDGYDDFGWNYEIDPVTKEIKDYDGGGPDKIWAMGNFRHENIVVTADSAIAYQGEDNANLTTGFVYKYILDNKGDLSSGDLYVLRMTAPDSGEWVLIPNSTQTERNLTTSIAQDSLATPFKRVEDVELGPDGKVYFASTTQGKVFRFQDDGMTISQFETFVDSTSYIIDYGTGSKPVTFNFADNLVFDDLGNLWITQDGGGKHIWVVAPTHTPLNPDIRIFANSPRTSEATGLTFSPDFRFMFMSFQHPDTGNVTPMMDVQGNSFIMDRDITLVIGRKEYLGNTASGDLPVSENHTLELVSLYPNPVSDHLNVSLRLVKPGVADFRISDIQGKIVQRESRNLKAGENQLGFEVESLPSGTYFLTVRIGNQVVGRKFQVQ